MTKRSVGPLIGDGIALRLLEERDLPLTREWRNRDDVRRWFFHTDPITNAGHREWFARYRERDDDFVFIIEETRHLLRPVGQVALYEVDWHAGVAEYGRLMIGDAGARGRGIARRATERLLDEAFGPLALREIHLEVRADNLAARALYERCAFAEIGVTDHGAVRMARHK
ncbi:MAG TPA: GNAT family N-acetyltransferase [Vicinamibacterales bacterium]|nr:GNAT family N-acetyltransferase [Vicinamibacterales bacterium]